MIITFQEFQKHESDRAKWLGQAIAQYKRSDEYKIAEDADKYDAQQNTAINAFVKKVYDITGVAMVDFTATNNRLASNFFHRLNVQRNSYLLGNGVSFAGATKEQDENGKTVVNDATKNALGKKFDATVFDAAYYALIHRVSYTFCNDGEYSIFPMTQFMPIVDAESGALRAGARFWALDWGKTPITVVLYEEDGYSTYRTKDKKYGLGALELVEKKQAYKQFYEVTAIDGKVLVGEENYAFLPIIPCYATKNKISTLVGMKEHIDAYDLIKSGFANDETDVAQIYWMISNASGMDDADVAAFRDRLLLQHVAVVDNQNSTITAHSQEVPYNSRETCLKRIKEDMYRDFGGVDVSAIAGGQAKTATEINAAFVPLDEEADEFEKHVTEYIKMILAVMGMNEDEPVYKRNRISNQKEETEMVMLAANYLDDETVLNKLPFITVDEVDDILARKLKKDTEAFKKAKELAAQKSQNEEEEEEEGA